MRICPLSELLRLLNLQLDFRNPKLYKGIRICEYDEVLNVGECEICGNEGSRLEVDHEEYGKIMVCRECWKDIVNKGKKVYKGTGSGGGSTGGCPSCNI